MPRTKDNSMNESAGAGPPRVAWRRSRAIRRPGWRWSWRASSWGNSSSSARRWSDGKSCFRSISWPSPAVIFPALPRRSPIVPHNRVLSDLVLQETMNQQFAVSEIHAGRWPLWTPNQFCGSPFAGYPKYSPFKIPAYCSASPTVFAWTPLCLAVFTGLGAYLFCRRVLRVGPWPATIAAWCWPLTGFFVFWMGYYLPLSVGWLPWILWPSTRPCGEQAAGQDLGLPLHVPDACQRPARRRRASAVGVGALCRLVFHRRVRPTCFTRAGLAARWRRSWPAGAWDSSWPRPICCRCWSTRKPVPAWAAQPRRRGAAAGRAGSPAADRVARHVRLDARRQLLDASRGQGSRNALEGNQLESSAATYTGLLATLLCAVGLVQPPAPIDQHLLGRSWVLGAELVSGRAGLRAICCDCRA